MVALTRCSLAMRMGLIGALAGAAAVFVSCVPWSDDDRSGCGIGAADLQRWYGWDLTEREVRGAPGTCVFDGDDGVRTTIRIGTPTLFLERLEELADMGDDDSLSRFDPSGDHVFMDALRGERMIGVGAAHGEVIIVDVEPVSGWVADIGSLVRFALERRQPHDLDQPTESLSSLRADPLQCGLRLEAFSPTGSVGLGLGLPTRDLDPTTEAFGSDRIPTDVSAGVTVGRDLDVGRCTDLPDGLPELDAVWPVVAGTIDWTWRPDPDAWCGVTVTIETSGLVVERPDGSTVPLPDLTIVNDRYGDAGVDGCYF